MNSLVYLIVNHLSDTKIEFKIYDTKTDKQGLGKEIIIKDKNLHLYKKNSLIPRLNSINIELSHVLILNLDKRENNIGLVICKDSEPVTIENTEQFIERLSFKFSIQKPKKKKYKSASDDSGIQSMYFKNRSYKKFVFDIEVANKINEEIDCVYELSPKLKGKFSPLKSSIRLT
jgi:hypothetical protein